MSIHICICVCVKCGLSLTEWEEIKREDFDRKGDLMPCIDDTDRL